MRTELTQDNRADLLDELRDSADVRRELNLTWMPLTPEQLLRDLSRRRRCSRTAPHLSPAERSLLLRDRSAPWTEADVPLLDEAAELLGEDESAARLAARRRAAERAADVGYAEASLRSSGAESGLHRSPPRCWPGGSPTRDRHSPSRSAPRATAPGRSGTSSSTRPRSSPR